MGGDPIFGSVRRLRALEGVCDAAITALASGARCQTYEMRKIICWAGEGRGSIFGIASGRVRLWRVLSDGRDHVPWWVYQGELLLQLPPSIALESMAARTEVISIPKRAFAEARDRYADLSARVDELEDALINHLAESRAGICEPRADKCVASEVLLLSARLNTGRVPHTCAELGQMTGRRRHTVGVALDTLERAGLVQRSHAHGHGQYVTVLDREKLAEYCGK